MKVLKYIIAGVFALAAVWFLVSTWSGVQKGIKGPINMDIQPKAETTAEKMARCRAAAAEAVRAECTNEIIGLRAIISQSANISDDEITNWTAEATADFINPVGGVGRTNLFFTFTPYGDFRAEVDAYKTAYEAARHR